MFCLQLAERLITDHLYHHQMNSQVVLRFYEVTRVLRIVYWLHVTWHCVTIIRMNLLAQRVFNLENQPQTQVSYHVPVLEYILGIIVNIY